MVGIGSVAIVTRTVVVALDEIMLAGHVDVKSQAEGELLGLPGYWCRSSCRSSLCPTWCLQIWQLGLCLMLRVVKWATISESVALREGTVDVL